MDENLRRELWRDWETSPSNFSGPHRAERVFRLEINLTDGAVSEPAEFAFPLRAIIDPVYKQNRNGSSGQPRGHPPKDPIHSEVFG